MEASSREKKGDRMTFAVKKILLLVLLKAHQV